LKKQEEYSDVKLIAVFRETGNLEVLGNLYERYMHLVYGVCLKYFEDREDARDGVNGIFEKLIAEVTKHEIENFKSWLYVLTKHYCLMKLRSERSKQHRQEKWENEQEMFMESSDVLHPIDEEEKKTDDALKACIEKLKKEQKQCIVLFYYNDRSYKEISDALGMEEKKVKSYIQNGKRNLKICIEKSS